MELDTVKTKKINILELVKDLNNVLKPTKIFNA